MENGTGSVVAFDDGVDRVDRDVVGIAEASEANTLDSRAPQACVFGREFRVDERGPLGLGQGEMSYDFRLDPISYVINSGQKHSSYLETQQKTSGRFPHRCHFARIVVVTPITPTGDGFDESRSFGENAVLGAFGTKWGSVLGESFGESAVLGKTSSPGACRDEFWGALRLLVRVAHWFRAGVVLNSGPNGMVGRATD